MCILRPGCASAMRPKSLMLAPGEQTDDVAPRFSQALQNHSERAVGPIALLLRLVERKAETDHARPRAPVADDLFLVHGASRSKWPRMTNLSGCALTASTACNVDRLAERNRARVQRTCLHRPQATTSSRPARRRRHRSRSAGDKRRHLAAVFPDVDLRVDDQHGVKPTPRTYGRRHCERSEAISIPQGSRLAGCARQLSLLAMAVLDWSVMLPVRYIAPIGFRYFEYRGEPITFSRAR